jgi:predicted O-methyltransferase YrrM
MRLEAIKSIVGNLKWMSFAQAQLVRDHLMKYRLSRILELGFLHGVSTCYLAAIAEEMCGHVTTCDLPHSAKVEPTAEQLLKRCGLTRFVTVYRDPEGAEWRMKTLIEDRAAFDFIYIDAAHTWNCTGLEFFLAEKLLRINGWILFDDLDYVLTEQPYANEAWALQLTKTQRETPQVRLVWELLAKQHPHFGDFIERDSWGWCRKTGRTL